jgi:hypothetical protein
MRANSRRQFYVRPLNPIVPAGINTFEMPDSSTLRFPADFLLRGALTRDPSRQTARLADQFLEQNRVRFRELDLEVEPRYDGTSVAFLVRAGIRVGAIPLLSPTTGKSDYGIVVRPRFAWTGIGEILGATG